MYDISGSAHFINKCDNGIVIHRNRDPAAGPVDQVQVSILFVFVTVFTQGNTFVNLSCNCRFVLGRFGIRLLNLRRCLLRCAIGMLLSFAVRVLWI